MFKSILKHAYENVPFYHRIYKQYGVEPNDIKNIEDIKKLPIISKQDFRKYSVNERFSRNFNFQRCIEYRTSGSTGEPFVIYQEPKAEAYLRALHLRRLSAHGFRPWQTIVVFGPYWRTQDRERWFIPKAHSLSLVDDIQDNLSRLRAIKPDVIWGPPSYLRLLAEAAHKIGVGEMKPQIIITGGETLDPLTRSRIESVFEVKVFDEYGTVEVASRAIAWQCNKHAGYHINMDAVYLEFLKEDEFSSVDEGGQIVATNLFRYATPMIRYMTGDIGMPSKIRCDCGRSFPILDSIEGRSDDFLIMPKGRFISPRSALAIFSNIPRIRQFQIVQENLNKIIISIEPISIGNFNTKQLKSRCLKLFGRDVQIEFDLGPIIIEKGKKPRIVTSKIAHIV
jgi:phenylacetate-CoA ligase